MNAYQSKRFLSKMWFGLGVVNSVNWVSLIITHQPRSILDVVGATIVSLAGTYCFWMAYKQRRDAKLLKR